MCAMAADGCPTLTNLLVVVVGGIPIAMPTVLTVTLALGAYKLAKEGAIVARMSAVEEMAGMDILCSDKTGALLLLQRQCFSACICLSTQNLRSKGAAPVFGSCSRVEHMRNAWQPDVCDCACMLVCESLPLRWMQATSRT